MVIHAVLQKVVLLLSPPSMPDNGIGGHLENDKNWPNWKNCAGVHILFENIDKIWIPCPYKHKAKILLLGPVHLLLYTKIILLCV